MNQMIIDGIGFVAAFLTTSAFVPQVVQVVKTKSVKDISLPMFALFLGGVASWMTYGLLIKSPPVIIANLLGMIMNTIIIVYKIKYDDKN